MRGERSCAGEHDMPSFLAAAAPATVYSGGAFTITSLATSSIATSQAAMSAAFWRAAGPMRYLKMGSLMRRWMFLKDPRTSLR